MADERSPISSSRLSSSEVTRASFAVVRRGFDPREVRSFLDYVGREIETFDEREAEFRRQIAEANERAKNPVIDEASLTAALGQQSAQILRTAHEEARQVLEEAQAQATEMLQSAQARSGATAIEAEQRAAGRVGDAEIAATNLEAEAAKSAQQIIGQAHADGETLVARAREQGRGMIEQAQEARGRVLADMNARRRMMHLQIEQLRAARDELAASVIGVRETVDRLTEEIASSDHRARAAAQEVARRQPTPEAIQDEALTEASLDAATMDAGVSTMAEPANTEEPGVVEELFAKIRAGARDENEESSNGDAEAPSPSGPDAEEVAARDASVEAAIESLSRKMKRSLQDAQNHLLDELRAEGTQGLVLEPADAQTAAFSAAAFDSLRDAANAGRAFALDRGAPEGPGLSDGAVAVIAQALAGQMAIPLRRRLDDALASADPTAEVNTAFREWRGGRVDRVVGDAVLEAHAAAVIAMVGDGAVRWATGSADGCPDCADNALEGPVRAGSPFPTGHASPPAHAGCRCAILPIS